jgi:hypothetical protein
MTIPEGVTNVFLHGIVTAAIAVDGSSRRLPLAVSGGEGVVVSDLTLVSAAPECIKLDSNAKKVRVENIVHKRPEDWSNRKR